MEMTVAIAKMIGELTNEIHDMQTKLTYYKRYIRQAAQRRDETIAELDDMLRNEDLYSDVEKLHERLIDNWPDLPWDLRNR